MRFAACRYKLLKPSPVGAAHQGAALPAAASGAVSHQVRLSCSPPSCRYVLLKPSPVGAAQVLRFQRLLSNGVTLDTNSRPVQPLHTRTFVH